MTLLLYNKITLFLVLTSASVHSLDLSDLVPFSTSPAFDVSGATLATTTTVVKEASKSFVVAGTEFTKIILGTNVGSSIRFVQNPQVIQYIIDPYTVYNEAGKIYSESSTDNAVLDQVNNVIQNARQEFKNFLASWIFVATWEDMTFRGASAAKGDQLMNTYQAVIAVDDSTEQTFLMLNYVNLEWSICSQDATKDALQTAADTGVGSSSALVYFRLSSDGGLHYSLPGSGSTDVVNLATTSNVGVPGRWIFNISQDVQDIVDRNRHLQVTSTEVITTEVTAKVTTEVTAKVTTAATAKVTTSNTSNTSPCQRVEEISKWPPVVITWVAAVVVPVLSAVVEFLWTKPQVKRKKTVRFSIMSPGQPSATTESTTETTYQSMEESSRTTTVTTESSVDTGASSEVSTGSDGSSSHRKMKAGDPQRSSSGALHLLDVMNVALMQQKTGNKEQDTWDEYLKMRDTGFEK